ncbi:hypothetical protein ACJX0J_037972, partial [Zea mays]
CESHHAPPARRRHCHYYPITIPAGEDLGILSDDEEGRRGEDLPELEIGLSNFIVVDNLLVVPPEKFDKLENVIRKICSQIAPAAVLAAAAEHSRRTRKSRDSPFHPWQVRVPAPPNRADGRYARPPGLQLLLLLLLSPLLSVGSPQINGRCRGSPTPPSTEGVKDLLPLYSAIPIIRGRHQRPPTHTVDGRCPRFDPIAPSSPSALPHPPPHAVDGARRSQVAEDPPHPPPPPSRPLACPRMQSCYRSTSSQRFQWRATTIQEALDVSEVAREVRQQKAIGNIVMQMKLRGFRSAACTTVLTFEMR